MRTLFHRCRTELRQFFGGVTRHQISTFAASGAFYMFLSLVPFIILVFSVLPYTSLTEEMILRYLDLYLPDSTMELIESIVGDVYSASAALVPFSALATLWSAGKAFSALIKGMEEINDSPSRTSFFMRRLRASVYTLVLLLTIIFSLMIMVYGQRLTDLILKHRPNLSVLFGFLMHFRFLIVMVVLAAIFLLLYKWVPHVKIRYSRELPGAIFAAVSWVAFSWVFSAYVSYSGSYSTYGSLATIVIAMLWMYYCMYIILLGDYLNRYLDVLRRRRKLN